MYIKKIHFIQGCIYLLFFPVMFRSISVKNQIVFFKKGFPSQQPVFTFSWPFKSFQFKSLSIMNFTFVQKLHNKIQFIVVVCYIHHYKYVQGFLDLPNKPTFFRMGLLLHWLWLFRTYYWNYHWSYPSSLWRHLESKEMQKDGEERKM